MAYFHFCHIPIAIRMQMRFLYPYRMEKWILRTIADRWRQHKSNLKSIYFDVNKSKEVNYNNDPDGVIVDQWIALVDNWMTQKAQVHGYSFMYKLLPYMCLSHILEFLKTSSM
jgi:hypothetical protein